MTTRLSRHLLESARNNTWANHRLYAACAALSEADLRAERVAFFKTIFATLSHILIVDWYYIDALLGAGRGLACFEREEPFDTFADLRAAQRESDIRLIDFCERLTEDALDASVRLVRDGGVVYVERAENVLGHLYQHQIHHRGQVHGMLSGTPVAPPQLDEYWLDQDAHLREHELRDLGLPVR